MRLKDFKLLSLGVHLLTDGKRAYYASVFPTYLGDDKSINIMSFNDINMRYYSYISIICVNNNPYIQATVGSMNIYSKDIDHAVQFLEYVGCVDMSTHENNKIILSNHRMNMKISRKIRS